MSNAGIEQTRDSEKHCGLVAIVGRPNVGKSTLLNYLVGEKISITSRKPQTTRHRILGIKTTGQTQMVFVDTPGMHTGQKKAINRYMNRTVQGVIGDVDLILFMTDRLNWTDEDMLVLSQLEHVDTPVYLIINKVDLLEDKTALLPAINKATEIFPFKEIFPLSALKQYNLEDLEKAIVRHMPAGDFFYPEDQLTDRNARFLAAEFIREKITRQIGDELPYEATVEIEEFRHEGDIIHISALILVEKGGQKKIVIGDKGSRLKLIGSEARRDLEKLLDAKVMLSLWVKVKSGWSDDERALKSLGYDDFSRD